MIEGKPSQTAMMTAVQRAHHYMTAPEPKILRDNVAFSLTGLPSLAVMQSYIDAVVKQFAALSDQETAETFMKRIDGAVCMRSRVVEEKLADALQNSDAENGVQQLVILGAGLDSLAYRRADLTDGLQIFEVDHPSTQAWKRNQLQAAGIEIPSNLSFTAFDFENETLAQALAAGGVDSSKVTFFTWLGVHMYLTDEAVKATLNVMGSYARGSEMVMDFISPSYVKFGGVAEDSVAQLTKVVTQMGEPIKSQYSEADLTERLNEAGFDYVDYLTARWLIDNYMDGEQAAFDMPDEATSILWARKS